MAAAPPRPASRTSVHVVPHTHWDREWYLPAAPLQLRLASLVDDLLATLGRRPELPSFLLDGQAVVLDDYAALRPDRIGALRRALADGRIEAGPWYVLADELLVSGEALVRNLLAGAQAVRRAGGRPMRVGYSPDAFGHSGALPMIFAGFGIGVALVWRGLGGARGRERDLYRWQSADGSEVLLVHLGRPGYEDGKNLPADPRALRQRWLALRAMHAARAVAPHWLLLNGADHHALQHELPEAVAALAQIAPDVDVSLSSLEAYADAVARWTLESRARVPVLRGELVQGRRHAWVLLGTHGTRLHLKQANARCQRLLERRAEPLAALAGAYRGLDLREDLRAAWRTLLENHPHDSICGTSADAVHREMVTRFERCEEMGEEIAHRALDAVAGHDPDAAREAGRERWMPALLVFNPQARSFTGLIEAEVALFRADLRVGQQGPKGRGAKVPKPGELRLTGPDGARLAVQELERREGTDRIEAPRYYPDCDVVEWRRVVFAAAGLPALGVVAVRVDEVRGAAKGRGARGGVRGKGVPASVRVDERGMDNGRVSVRVEADGSVAMADRRTGLSARGLGGIVDERDLGDSYTSSPRGVIADVPDAVAVRVVHAGPLRGELEIVRRWDAADLELATTVRLDAEARHVALTITGENRRGDHRLRVVFPLGERTRRVVADGQFGPVERAPAPPRSRRRAGELEADYPTAAMQRCVSVAGTRKGLTVFADGLPQYEARVGGEVLVTILRACGQMSRGDIPERPGHAGWPTPTPDGQCRGPFQARVAVMLHDRAALDDRAAIEAVAEDFLAPPWAVMRRPLLAMPEPTAGPVLEGAALAFSAMKPMDDGKGVVLRCYNPGSEPRAGAWRVPWHIGRASLCRLDETAGTTLVAEPGPIGFEAGSREVVSMVIR
jgi:alpha-mannosidase